MLSMVNPDDAAHGDQCHRGQNHQTVVLIAVVVAPLRHHLVAEQHARAQQLADEGHNHQDDGVAQAVANAVEERRPRTVVHREGLKATHEDTVGDNQANEYRQLLAHVIIIGDEDLLHNDNQRGDHYQLHDDADVGGDGLAQERNNHVAERQHANHRDAHHDGGLQTGGDCKRGANTQNLDQDRIVLGQRVEQCFFIFLR